MSKSTSFTQDENKNDCYIYKSVDDIYVISINNHQEVASTLEKFCNDLNITGGEVTGIGAINQATLRCFNPELKKYIDKTFNEQMEIANLTGNIGVLNGKIYLHLHATLGRTDYTALAGHLLSATICGAGEFVIRPYSKDLPRYYNDQIGLNLYDFTSK